MIYIWAQWVKTNVDQDNIENVFKIPIIDLCEFFMWNDKDQQIDRSRYLSTLW